MKIKRDRHRMSSALAAISLSAISAASLFIYSQHNGAFAQGVPKLEDSVVFAMNGGPPLDVLQKCTVDGFTKKFNVRVDFLAVQTQQALARVIAQRNNPTIDVMQMQAEIDYAGFKEGVLLPITPSMIPNLANVDPKFPPEPDRGAAWAGSFLGIEYNTKVFKEKGLEPPTSWRDVWDPKYKGHVGIYNLGVGTSRGMLAVAGFLNGGDSKNFDAAFENIAKLKPNLYTIFQSAPQLDAALTDGNVWLGFSFSGRPLAMMQQGDPIGFVQPSEGTVFSKTTLSIVKGAPHPNAALAFVNWMLSEEAQSCLPRAGYAPVIKGFEVPAELTPYMTLQRNIIPVDWAYIQDHMPELLLRWNKEIDG